MKKWDIFSIEKKLWALKRDTLMLFYEKYCEITFICTYIVLTYPLHPRWDIRHQLFYSFGTNFHG